MFVFDPGMDTAGAATAIMVYPFATPLSTGHRITDPKLIRALYNHPTATLYGKGSYTVGGIPVPTHSQSRRRNGSIRNGEVRR